MQLKGWEKVLKFTYIQMIKAKSFIVSSIVMVVIFGLMIAGANFLPALFLPESETIQITDDDGNLIAEIEAYKIEKVYIIDNSGLDIDFSFLPTFEVEYENVAEMDYSYITESEDAIVLAIIEKTSTGYEVRMSRPESTELIGSADCFQLLGVFHSAIHNENLISLGVAAEDIPKTTVHISTTVNVDGEETKSEIADAISAAMTMAISLILAVLIITYGQLTAQAIATEKASRVMELLLTSVRPLAVIVGKVLASVLVALTTMITIGGITVAVFFAFFSMIIY